MQKNSQAALVMLHGGHEKRRYPVRREVTIIGKARGADLIIDGPDVSHIHCVVWRTANGFFVRDTGSRIGTRVNGEQIHEATLYDGDILQIGMFSFGLELPPRTEPVAIPERKLRRLRRSRANFARFALEYRRKLAEQDSPPREEQDLHRKASALRDRVRLFDEKLQRLQAKERELAQERDRLEKERCMIREWKQQREANGSEVAHQRH